MISLTLNATEQRIHRPGALNPHTLQECVTRLLQLPDESLSHDAKAQIADAWLEEITRAQQPATPAEYGYANPPVAHDP